LSLSFQDLILTLHRYWGAQGCVILQPYDMEMGAGTFHPATVLRALADEATFYEYLAGAVTGFNESNAHITRLRIDFLYQHDLKNQMIEVLEFRIGVADAEFQG